MEVQTKMKEYSITVMLAIPVKVRADSEKEAIEIAEDVACEFLDDSHVDDINIDSEREI